MGRASPVIAGVSTGWSAGRRRAPRGQGDALRGEILAATRQLLSETGSEASVSIRAVAERVGVTTPSIYLHFRNKSDLLDAVCAQVFETLAAALEEAAAATASPLERLLAQGRAYIDFALANREQYRLAFAFTGPPKSVDAVLRDRCLQEVLETVRLCMDAGILPPDERGPQVMALQLWAKVHGVVSLMISKPWLPWDNVDYLADQSLRVALAGCAVAGRASWMSPDQLAEWLAELEL